MTLSEFKALTAKEMFEKLGYKQTQNGKYFIKYVDIKDSHVKYEITFCNFMGCVEITPKLNGEEFGFIRLDKHLLIAINKQLEEMEKDEDE